MDYRNSAFGYGLPSRGGRSFLNTQDTNSGLRQALRTFIDERGYQYAEDWFTYTLATSAALAAGASASIQLNIQNDSAFEWIYATGQAISGGAVVPSPAIQVTIIDSASARNLMNGPIPFPNLCGTGQQPFILPIPRRFMPSTQVTFLLNNYSAATSFSSVQISLIGRKIYQQGLPGNSSPPLARFVTWKDNQGGNLFTEDLYAYDFPNAANIAAAGNATVTQIIEGDSDFEWIATTFCEGITAGASTGPAASRVSALILDGGSQRNLLNVSTPISNIAGTGVFPNVLPQPRIFPAKSPVVVTFTNNGAGGTDNVRLTLWGRKLFQLGW